MGPDDEMAPPPPPPPAGGPGGPSSGRYAYLVSRLRNRQITMNEATELFELQQSTLASALARAQSTPPATGGPAPMTAPNPPPPSGGGGLPFAVDDAFWMGLLAAGAGAGLLAAVLKRSRDAGSAPTGAEPSGASSRQR